jgi:hypothetical protein
MRPMLAAMLADSLKKYKKYMINKKWSIFFSPNLLALRGV